MTTDEAIQQCRSEQLRCAEECLRSGYQHGGAALGAVDWLWEEIELVNEQKQERQGPLIPNEDWELQNHRLTHVCPHRTHLDRLDGVIRPVDPANPKDLLGAKKVSLSKIPPVALALCAAAMMDGARKYTAFNWREKPVQAGIYIDAALRHLLAWFDREEEAYDSGVHHLGHAMACCAILMDAQASGCLVDDRPSGGGAFTRTLKDIQVQLEGREEL